ncbi:flagellar biosynthetic protein FliO [Polynucleobacter sp. JS-Mosq-20-D10]|jgi:flagellar protein FliO/FliZ|uniref:flagellar biosynthetic protein FliO n=1 Tax=Polynucleobacter sp. JS-Mosq-20-D10 TaxID=2576922 RepID=UPI001BFE1996|nr:flagellar biosynthetic protein FliO [Polynucleobacter sp. JS-Mosq-20-D10]QWE00901.1 flagellar biosynthetic protein FliO [Polynucleobacter sp. JS-Mosq-20-D10]
MGTSVGGMLLFSFIWLALAAALIWVVAYLVKRDSAVRASNPHIMILAQQALGPRERVIVVNVLNRILVIGHTPTQINLLTELDPEDVAHLKPQQSNIDFANQLRQLVKRKMG